MSRGSGRKTAPIAAGRSLTVVAVVLLGTFAFASCSAINTIKNDIHDIRGNKAVIDASTPN